MSEAIKNDVKKRNQKIIRTSVIGILTNIVLSIVKATIGLITHSIAFTLDAVNNLTDAGSSIITIFGTKIASKEADHTHPFGHGRYEYLSAMVVAMLVLYAGVTSLLESIDKIINPVTPEYTIPAVSFIALTIIVKIVLGTYFKKVGKEVNSEPLVNSGEDARLDAVISAATVLAAILFMTMGVSLEAYLGLIISLIIIKSAVDMLRETLSEIVGKRADYQLTKKIKGIVNGFDDVLGAYDLVVNDYGPNDSNASVHIEIPSTYTMNQLDLLTREIAAAVYEETGVVITAVGVYSVNRVNDENMKIEEDIRKKVLAIEYVLQMHGFLVNIEKKRIYFDVVVTFEAPDRMAVYEEVLKTVQEAYPDYTVQISLDIDYSLTE